jgi:hypothetical protein
MHIRETFATKIEERIEPVVKVADRDPEIVVNELKNLVVTAQWEKHLYHMLEEYTDAFGREDERGIGVWISGFFGSGKSLLMKVLGVLLKGGELQGQTVHQLFFDRLPPHSSEKADIERALAVCRNKITTALVGGNLHAKLARSNDPLILIAFRLFAEERNYTNNWSFAWAIEYQIDIRGLTEQFHNRACELSGVDWQELVLDADIYSDDLYAAAAEVMPDVFTGGPASVAKAIENTYHNGITPDAFIERMRRWCMAQERDGRRHRLLLQLDELGQWIASGDNATARAMEVQILVEAAERLGQGRIWIAVTAHGDVQALRENVQQEVYAKINQRFSIQCKLSNEDINEVVQERILRKTQEARSLLSERFLARKGDITDLGSLKQARRVYTTPTEENFAEFYPYLPWTVNVIPNIIKGIAQSTGRDEALTGSNRTMIGVVQGGIIDTRGFLDQHIGPFLCLADLYDQLSTDAPTETRTDIHRIESTVPKAGKFTTRVARALYLLGRDEYIPSNLHNVTLALIDSFDANLSDELNRVKIELERLVDAGYAKQVGETYVFLSTQQRGFQDKVRRREGELYNQTYDLIQKLKDYQSADALRFDQVAMPGLAGNNKAVKIELDGKIIHNPPATAQVTVHVYSPIQRILDPDIGNDTEMRIRSNHESDGVFLRMGEARDLRRALARAVATRETIDEVLRSSAGNDPEKQVARQAQKDLEIYDEEVRYALDQAIRAGVVFFRGSIYNLIDEGNSKETVRSILGQLLPIIYSRFHDLQHKVVNEEAAVKAALYKNTANTDLRALGVYRADGEIDETNALISALKGRLPQAENDQGTMYAEQLRSEFERPPYGWDGNAVRVGLALLLQASQCRLIENGDRWTDPQNPEVLQMLTKAQRFKSLRVQGVRSELTSQEIQTLRGYIEIVFDTKVAAVPTTMNNALGKKLQEVHEQAAALKDWSSAANCPLPFAFEAGGALIEEMLNGAAPGVRLPLFEREWEKVAQYLDLLQYLTNFKSQHGPTYIRAREFFNSMVNVTTAPLEVTRFINDWRVVNRERTVTDAQRWSEILTTYHTAQQAITDQIAQWRQEIEQGLRDLQTKLRPQVQEAGVPDEKIDEEVTALSTDIQQLQARLANSDIGYGEMLSIRTTLGELRMNKLPMQIRELNSRYQPEISEPTREKQEVRLNLREAIGQTTISSPDDLERVITRLRERITLALNQQKTVIID